MKDEYRRKTKKEERGRKKAEENALIQKLNGNSMIDNATRAAIAFTEQGKILDRNNQYVATLQQKQWLMCQVGDTRLHAALSGCRNCGHLECGRSPRRE